MKRQVTFFLHGAIALCLLLSLTACRKEEDETRTFCEAFFDAYVENDSDALEQALAMSEEDVQLGKLQSQIAKHLTVKVEASEVGEDAATISATITNVDLEAVLHMLPEQTDNVEDARKELLKLLEEEDLPMKEFPVQIELIKDEEWTVTLTPELSNALLGGLADLLSEEMEEVGS